MVTHSGCSPQGRAIHFPQQLTPEDFQTELDRVLSAHLQRVEETRWGQCLRDDVLRPLCDDVNIAELSVSTLELRPGQFADRPDVSRIVAECARMLQVPTPRVFFGAARCPAVATAGFAEPVIVLPMRIVTDFRDPAELRFIIGREMGHIRCGHAKWRPLVHRLTTRIHHVVNLPDPMGSMVLSPVLKWSREAEMSADNAGLICCQSREAAERVLAALALGTSTSRISRISMETFLAQRAYAPLESHAELLMLWREASREIPFVRDRIFQLRHYEASRQYQALWK